MRPSQGQKMKITAEKEHLAMFHLPNNKIWELDRRLAGSRVTIKGEKYKF